MALFVEKVMSAATFLKHQSTYFLTEKSVIYDRVKDSLKKQMLSKKDI